MILSNLLLDTNRDAVPKSIVIQQNRIAEITEKQYPAGIDLDGALVLPGFINSHDHLDFNLFPLLANRLYNNYHEWGRDIQVNNRDIIDKVLQVPQSIRVQWGIYKNLVHGFTTVVNHGKPLCINQPLIHVHQRAQSIHSVGFDEKWYRQLLNIFKYRDRVAIHIGEGVDALAAAEIDALVRANRLKRKLIGIHAVAMNTRQAAAFRALVWCPASNQSLFGKTAPMDVLKKYTRILFGSDSTLTAPWNLCEQISAAIDTKMLSAKEMLEALTVNASDAWAIKNRGLLQTGKYADMVVYRKGLDITNGFPGILGADNILMVIANGQVVLFDEILSSRFFTDRLLKHDYSKIKTGKYVKYIAGNLVKLADATLKYHPDIQIPLNILGAC